MPISHQTHYMLLSDILVQREARQRKEIEVEDLVQSLKRNGLINPIVVERETRVLVAGERRLTAMQQLGWVGTHVKFAEELSPIELQIIEAEENVKRKNLDWADECKAVQKIHLLFCQLDPEWSITETAAELGLTKGNVSLKLKVVNEIDKGNEKVTGANSTREAYNIIKRKESRQGARDLEDLLDANPAHELQVEPQNVAMQIGDTVSGLPGGEGKIIGTTPQLPAPAPDVICTSFLDWAPAYRGKKFNLIHCDFPYGINLFTGAKFTPQQEGSYEDSKDVYFALLECFVQNLDNFCSLSAHLIFWYSREHEDATRSIFRTHAPSFEIVRDPLIWGKTDNAGIAKDMRRDPRHTYENALFSYRGKRMTVTQKSDFYPGPTDRTLHPSAKPIPMLKHFFAMCVDENTEMLDPTCGAGSSLCAADALGALRVFGMDKDAEHAETAQIQLNNQRKLAKATK